jgi:hypothetical protein
MQNELHIGHIFKYLLIWFSYLILKGLANHLFRQYPSLMICLFQWNSVANQIKDHIADVF